MTSSKEDAIKEQDNKSKIQQLLKSLEYAKLNVLGLETMIKVIEEEVNIKIRKRVVSALKRKRPRRNAARVLNPISYEKPK